MRIDWQHPHFVLEDDARIVIAPGGDMVAYVDVWDPEPHVRMYGMGRVHPRFKGRGIGTVLSNWVAGRGRQSVTRAPMEARVVLLQSVLNSDLDSQRLLRQQGYRRVRFFNRMVIEMESPPPEPRVPNGISIRLFRRGQEEPAVVRAVRDAFQDHWGHVESPFEEELKGWLHWMDNDPDFDPSLWFVATDGGEIAGVSLCNPKSTEDPDSGWVNTLGVRRPWRRRGLALALLQHSFGEFYRRGQRRVALGVDADSLTGATRLYERAGMYVQRRYASYELELRPGADLATRSVQD